jgi:hypothetical protein
VKTELHQYMFFVDFLGFVFVFFVCPPPPDKSTGFSIKESQKWTMVNNIK